MRKKMIKFLVSAAMLFGFAIVSNNARTVEAATYNEVRLNPVARVADMKTGNYVVQSNASSGSVVMAFNSTTSQTYMTATPKAMTDNGVIPETQIWRFEEVTNEAGYYRISVTVAGQTTYIGGSTSTALARTTSVPTTEVYKWQVQEGTGGILRFNGKTTSRYLEHNNSATRFSTYTGGSGYPDLNLYEVITVDNQAAANSNVAADLAALGTLLDNYQYAENVTGLPTLTIVGEKGSVITWTSSDDSLASVNPLTGVVTLGVTNDPQETIVCLTASLVNTVADKTATETYELWFEIVYVDPNVKYDLTFNGFAKFDMLQVTGEVYLPNLTGADVPNGKVFSYWVEEETGNGYLADEAYTVYGNRSFSAVFSNNYAGVDTQVSIKLNYSKTQEEGAIEYIPSFSTLTANTEFNNDSTNWAPKFDLSSSKFVVNMGLGGGVNWPTYNKSADELRLYSHRQSGNGNQLILESLAGEIDFITIVTGSTSGTDVPVKIFADRDSESEIETITTSSSSTYTCDVGSNVVRLYNTYSGGASNLQLQIKKLTISVDGVINTYDIADTTGIRFSTTFGEGSFAAAVSAGVLVIPALTLDEIGYNYGCLIIDLYLAQGANVQSQILEIPASNKVNDDGKLSFAGVIDKYPTEFYETELIFICYYVDASGQIYFSYERMISLKQAAQTYIDQAETLELSAEIVEVLHLIAD